jgi:hypothetical protein
MTNPEVEIPRKTHSLSRRIRGMQIITVSVGFGITERAIYSVVVYLFNEHLLSLHIHRNVTVFKE